MPIQFFILLTSLFLPLLGAAHSSHFSDGTSFKAELYCSKNKMFVQEDYEGTSFCGEMAFIYQSRGYVTEAVCYKGDPKEALRLFNYGIKQKEMGPWFWTDQDGYETWLYKAELNNSKHNLLVYGVSDRYRFSFETPIPHCSY